MHEQTPEQNNKQPEKHSFTLRHGQSVAFEQLAVHRVNQKAPDR